MRAIIFAPQHNTGGDHPHDADEFQSEARAFCGANGLPISINLFDNHLPDPQRRDAVLSRFRLALFCHGWANGVQAGFRIAHAAELAREIARVANPSLTVALYCCSTGADNDPKTDDLASGPGGDGGFADALRDALSWTGAKATVYAHANPGHCTRNPNVRVFSADEQTGGEWLVEKGSPLWPIWLRKLHSTDLRLRFPVLGKLGLLSELQA